MLINNLKKGIYLYLLVGILILLYEIVLYTIGHSFFKETATGSLIYDQAGNVRGSLLLAQNFKSNKYFWGRVNFEGGNNCVVAIYNDIFRNSIAQKYKQLNHPYDSTMITHSGSLLDPYIPKREALNQASRVAKERGITEQEVIDIIDKFTLARNMPFFELDIVNVTMLNSYFDGLIK